MLREWSDRVRKPDRSILIEAVVLGALQFLALMGFAIMLLAPQAVDAHPGGLAADGCHNDRKNGEGIVIGAKSRRALQCRLALVTSTIAIVQQHALLGLPLFGAANPATALTSIATTTGSAASRLSNPCKVKC